jgi:hypothetical protein
MSSSASSIENIHNAINSSNPFMIKFVDQHHIWDTSFPDVPEINAHVSDAVFNAIDQVSKNELPSIGIIITGEKGLGKTQVISRIRHRLQNEGKAFFVYMGNYGDLNYIKSEFRQQLTFSLKRIGVEEVTQWQELAANMVFTAKGDRPCSPKDLASGKFSTLVRNNSKTPEKWANIICSKKAELTNPYLVKAILWTLSEKHAPYAISWLSGQELTPSKAEELGLPNNTQKDELATFKTTCELLALISHYNNLVFCFDELDDPSYNADGFTRAQVVAALAKDLRNLISKCVLLLAMYPATLRDEIKLAQAQGAVYDRTADMVLELEYLNSDTSVALISKWLEDFYISKDLVPPHRLYPFNEDKIRGLGKEKPTARSLLKWCFDNWKIPNADNLDEISFSIPAIVTNPLEAAFENELQSVAASIDEYMEKSDVVGKALFCAFKELRGKEIEGVRVIDVEWINDVHLHLRIIAEENGRVVKIGTAAILQTNASSIGAALRKLIDYNKFNFTRGCLVRAKQISKSASAARNHLSKLLNEQGGEWVALLEEHIKPLIAIDALYTKLDNYELTKAQVDEFIAENHLIINNALVKEILSDPSGQEPIDLTDDDLPIRIPINASQGDEIEL